MDTVTISDEGLAKAKDWREYTKDNENISHTGVNPKEEASGTEYGKQYRHGKYVQL